MNRIFWLNPMFLGALIPLLMAVSCANPPLKAAQTRALGETPTIVSIEPANGAVGVKKDTNIVVTFSQPMNTLETEAAYYSKNEELDGANVRFSWNTDNTELTIDPNNDLQYNSGTHPDEVIERQYGFGFTEKTVDADGNFLPNIDFSFGTLKIISANIRFYISIEMDTTDRYPRKLFELKLGDDAANLGVRAFAFFNILDLPETLVPEDILGATLRMYKKGVIGSPYKQLKAPCTAYFCGPSTGSIQVNHVSDYLRVYYDSPVQVALGDLDKPAFNTSNPLRAYYETTTPNGWKSLNVTEAIKYDVKNRVIRGLWSKATFRLSFQRYSNNNNQEDAVEFSADPNENTPELFVYYLTP
jgi:Bacterial Ig-like domain